MVLEAAANGFEDGQGVRGGPAAQRDAPPLGDAVRHLCVDARSIDIYAIALRCCQQVRREALGCQLGIHIQKIRRGAEIAHIVVAAAARDAAYRHVGVVGRALQHFVHRAIAACRVDMYFFPAGSSLCRQLAGVALALGNFYAGLHACTGCGGADPGHQLRAGIGLARRRIDDKQLLHGAASSRFFAGPDR